MKILDNHYPLPDVINWDLCKIIFSIPYKSEDGYYVVFLGRSLNPLDIFGWYMARGAEIECDAFIEHKKQIDLMKIAN